MYDTGYVRNVCDVKILTVDCLFVVAGDTYTSAAGATLCAVHATSLSAATDTTATISQTTTTTTRTATTNNATEPC